MDSTEAIDGEAVASDPKTEIETPSATKESKDTANGNAKANDEQEDIAAVEEIVQVLKEEKKEQDSKVRSSEDSISNSKGAQILKNRFSEWKQTTRKNAQELWKEQGPTLEENAKKLWMQAPTLPRFPPIPRTPVESNKDNIVKEDVPLGQGSLLDDTFSSAENDEDLEALPDEKDSTEAPTSDDVTANEKRKTEVNVKEQLAKATEAASKATAAATIVAESVATGFRGRYSGDAKTTPVEPEIIEEPGKVLPESQTSLILKSRASEHMQAILDKLEPHQYAMLLGRGMLGVNLKQCYLKNHGAFIDFLVQGGQAEKSGIVRSGDLIVSLGEKDLKKFTIIQIPKEIADAKRPSVMVFAQGTPVALERMNYLDIVVPMMHRARYLSRTKDGITSLAIRKETSETTKAEEQKKEVSSDLVCICRSEVPVDGTIDNFVTPPAPSLELRKEFLDEVSQRCYDNFDVDELLQAADLDANFRAGLRNAFLACALDTRRLPFLVRFLSEMGESTEEDLEGSLGPSAFLMLFLELASFLDLYHVTPAERLKDVTSRIAYKFFLPTSIGKRLQPPLFDFHKIVPDASLRHLEFVLSGKSQSIPRDVFLDFLKAVVDNLTGAPFISFLISSECARMRAYLRNTAPFVKVPLKEMHDLIASGEKHAGAKNCFSYILIFLISHLEKEPVGEHKFAKDEQESKRVLGASNSICCSMFLKRRFLPTLRKFKSTLAEKQELDVADAKTIKVLCEQLWDVYIIGALELSSTKSESEVSYKKVQSLLTDIASSQQVGSDVELAKVILNSKLMQYTESLADELLYNYAADLHTKFREHKIHEWMCNELAKVRAGDPIWSNKEEIPILPQGCIKRLLRKAELPEGVSSHKPYKAPTNEVSSERVYQNADYAVVFGTSVGAELASQMPIPGIESSGIRRYACLPVSLDTDHKFDPLDADKILPPTFESYAVVPPRKLQPLADNMDETRMSSDGWEVSLVSFTIPNADSSSSDSSESSLYGVSLTFVQNSKSKSAINDAIYQTEFIEEAESETSGVNDKSKFVSPITFDENESNAETGKLETIRKVKVSSQLSKLNEKLKDELWASRIEKDEYHDSSHPATIGIALVSNRNVILAMRNSLSRMLFDYSKTPGQASGQASPPIRCSALIDILGSFAFKDIESLSLRCILEPYMRAGSATWVDRPFGEQKVAFEKQALGQLTACLPPTPLALMFATALLEQKIVLSSSRRSVLHSATVALESLLKPLSWSHLLVPLVPASLATDLLQYPAPFILGVPSQDAKNMDILGNLPRDVTLVDLDVGRVILAPAFGHDNEMVRKSSNPEDTSKALRAQTLYLAQALGVIFGNALRPDTWYCDSPSLVEDAHGPANVAKLLSIAQKFIKELLEGVSSCCYWIEEATMSYGSTVEPTVLFDEDRFFEIKNYRSTKSSTHLFPKESTGDFALSLEDFDLVMESFLRCQSMSTYISSRPRTEMVYY